MNVERVVDFVAEWHGEFSVNSLMHSEQSDSFTGPDSHSVPSVFQ